ncbi:thermonuclease family protein [Psychrobacillus sp. FSL H8-0484]|uniref:thermonuclease family protein n=1 Tax=Psychrobacillus sp. FSL H8-0484 TaxID=2921390 RepID=UPI0030F8C16D
MYKKLTAITLSTLLLSSCSESFTAPDYTNAPSIEVNKEVNALQVPESKAVIDGVVVEVLDGNQFKVQVGENALLRGLGLSPNQIILVRLALTQAPDRVDGQPFGEEAYVFVKNILEGKEVELELDLDNLAIESDSLSAFAYVNGKRVQDLLLENGFSMLLNNPNSSFLHISDLRSLEDHAALNGKGIWSIPEYADLETGFNQLAIKTSGMSKEFITSVSQELGKESQRIINDLNSEIEK